MDRLWSNLLILGLGLGIGLMLSCGGQVDDRPEEPRTPSIWTKIDYRTYQMNIQYNDFIIWCLRWGEFVESAISCVVVDSLEPQEP